MWEWRVHKIQVCMLCTQAHTHGRASCVIGCAWPASQLCVCKAGVGRHGLGCPSRPAAVGAVAAPRGDSRVGAAEKRAWASAGKMMSERGPPREDYRRECESAPGQSPVWPSRAGRPCCPAAFSISKSHSEN